MIGLTTTLRACYKGSLRSVLTEKCSLRTLASTTSAASKQCEEFLRDAAKVEPPQRLSTLLDLIALRGETLVDPKNRTGLNPFLVPLSRRASDNSLLCYIRWPTQREEMPLQLVRTTDGGIRLESLSTDHMCHRLAIEMDFKKDENAGDAIGMLNQHGVLHNKGDHLPFLNSGKFPTATENDMRLVVDRYLLTKVGSFADCYERLAENFRKQGNDVSALVTCERSVNVFYSWGHPMQFHSKMLRQLGREKECVESARASMGMPKWTLANSTEVSSIQTVSYYSL